MANNPIDFNTPYCDACLAQQHEETLTRQHEQLLAQGTGTRDQEKASRRDVSLAHLAILEHTSPDSQAARRTVGRADHGVQLLESPSRGASRPRTKSVSFAPQEHRAEEDVRTTSQFQTTSSQYVPGVYADQTGEGHLDTSDPNGEAARERAEKEAEEKAKEEAEANETEEQFKERLENMSEEEFAEYYEKHGGG